MGQMLSRLVALGAVCALTQRMRIGEGLRFLCVLFAAATIVEMLSALIAPFA